MKEVPFNFEVVWHIGTISFCEIYSRKILPNGYPDEETYHQEKYIEDREKQIPEKIFRRLWFYAIALCSLKPDYIITYYRQDKEDDVIENPNNRDFILPTSSNYFKGAETKNILYEDYFYHSNPFCVKSYKRKK